MRQADSPIVAVGAAVVQGGRVLFVRQTYPPFAGEWVVPAGHPEPGETVDQAIRRELREEAGLEARKDAAEIKTDIRKALRRFFNRRLDRRPMIIPVLLEL